MQTIQNIKKISLIFFVVTGTLHLGSSIFIANEYFFKEAFILNKTLDVPFVLTGLLYAFASLRIQFTDPQKNYKILDISLAIIIVLILAALITINLALPDIYA